MYQGSFPPAQVIASACWCLTALSTWTGWRTSTRCSTRTRSPPSSPTSPTANYSAAGALFWVWGVPVKVFLQTKKKTHGQQKRCQHSTSKAERKIVMQPPQIAITFVPRDTSPVRNLWQLHLYFASVHNYCISHYIPGIIQGIQCCWVTISHRVL